MTTLREIHLILHSHTDIGFTQDQPIIWDLHGRFIEEALWTIEQEIKQGLSLEETSKWTCECWMPVQRWWKTASRRDRRRFRSFAEEGLLEVTALPLQLAPLYDMRLLSEAMAGLESFRQETGLEVVSAMNCDVNGNHWYMADYLLDHGICGYTTAINTHFGHTPFTRPNLFHWRTRDGRTLPSFNGFTYGFANRFLQPTREAMRRFRMKFWPRLKARLHETDWTLPYLLVQGVHAFGDNGSIPQNFGQSIQWWNETGDAPRLRMVTPRQWWKSIQPFHAKIPIHAGDWTDSWNFGAGSAARELAVAKRAQVRLECADRLLGLPGHDPDRRSRISFARYRKAAWESLLVWCEHTWGADCGIGEPFSEDTDAMWCHKAHTAYQARSLAHLLRRDAVASLAHQVDPILPNGEEAALVVFNPLPWKRWIGGMLPATVSPQPRGGKGDDTAGRLYSERRPDWDPLRSVGLSGAWLDQIPQHQLRPVEVDGFGYRALPRSALEKIADSSRPLTGSQFDNGHVSLEVRPGTALLQSLCLKGSSYNFLNTASHGLFPCWIRETIDTEKDAPDRSTFFQMDWSSPELVFPDGWNQAWPAKYETAGQDRNHRIHELPDGIYGCYSQDLPGDLGQMQMQWFLPRHEPWLEIRGSWIQGLLTGPESSYLALPFHLPQANVIVDLGGGSCQPGQEQLPGVTTDFLTVGRWVDFYNGNHGVTITTSENPLCQLGEFRFGRNKPLPPPIHPVFLGWITNNYWETNFRAHQPGKVTFRYRIYPYEGPFHAAHSHRRGEEAAYDQVQAHPAPGPAAAKPTHILPSHGRFLKMTDLQTGQDAAINVVSVRRSGESLQIELYNDTREAIHLCISFPLRDRLNCSARSGVEHIPISMSKDMPGCEDSSWRLLCPSRKNVVIHCKAAS